MATPTDEPRLITLGPVYASEYGGGPEVLTYSTLVPMPPRPRLNRKEARRQAALARKRR